MTNCTYFRKLCWYCLKETDHCETIGEWSADYMCQSCGRKTFLHEPDA